MIVIDAPIERVWAEVADIEGQPRWMHEMKAVRLLTPGPVGVGTEAEADVRILGIAVTDPVTITEFEPPHRFAISHEGSFKGRGVITLEAGADGTHDDRPLGRAPHPAGPPAPRRAGPDARPSARSSRPTWSASRSSSRRVPPAA